MLNPLVLVVQVVPSGDVVNAPESPTAIHPPFHATPLKVPPTPDVRLVQVVPSGEVNRLPLPPTVTKRPFPYPTSIISVAPNPDVLEVQVVPSGDVSRCPFCETRTNNEPLYAIPSKYVPTEVDLEVQLIPSVEVKTNLVPLSSPATTMVPPPVPIARIFDVELAVWEETAILIHVCPSVELLSLWYVERPT